MTSPPANLHTKIALERRHTWNSIKAVSHLFRGPAYGWVDRVPRLHLRAVEYNLSIDEPLNRYHERIKN